MTEFDMVCELVNKTGCSFEEAKYAYEACGNDMLAAAVMIEKAQKEKKSNKGCININAEQIKANSKKAADKAESIIKKFSKINLTAANFDKTRTYFSLPSFAALILALVLWEAIVPLFIISLVCGVCYTISGDDMEDVFIGFNRKPSQPAAVVPAQYTYTAPVQPEIIVEPCTDKGLFNNSSN